jgi:hypothetical protein
VRVLKVLKGQIILKRLPCTSPLFAFKIQNFHPRPLLRPQGEGVKTSGAVFKPLALRERGWGEGCTPVAFAFKS